MNLQGLVVELDQHKSSLLFKLLIVFSNFCQFETLVNNAMSLFLENKIIYWQKI